MKLFSADKKGKVSAIVPAAGNSSRMGSGRNKQFLELCGKPLIAHSLLALENSPYIGEIIIVTRETDILMMSDISKEFGITKVTNIIKGGETRTESVKNGLLHAQYEYVAIHDGARPCVKTDLIGKTVARAFETGAAALGCRVADTLKRVGANDVISETVDRENLWQIQTPQVFKRDLLLNAYENGNTDGATDDCMLLESIGASVAMVEGDKSNIKVTFKEDAELAEAILKRREEE